MLAAWGWRNFKWVSEGVQKCEKVCSETHDPKSQTNKATVIVVAKWFWMKSVISSKESFFFFSPKHFDLQYEWNGFPRPHNRGAGGRGETVRRQRVWRWGEGRMGRQKFVCALFLFNSAKNRLASIRVTDIKESQLGHN